MVYFREIVWDASLLVTVNSRHCSDMTVGKIENGLERGFVKHRLNCLLITDPRFSLRQLKAEKFFCESASLLNNFVIY